MAKFLDTQGLTYFFNKLTGKFNKKIVAQDHAPSNPVEGDLWIDTDDDPNLVGVVGQKTTSDKDTYSCNYINDVVKDVYSTTEVKTNKVWIDGRPIYRTVVDKGDIAIPGGTQTLFTHNIPNIRQVTDAEFCVYYPATGYMQRGTYVDGDGYKITGADNTSVGVYGTTYMSAGYGNRKMFILEYTKTTD